VGTLLFGMLVLMGFIRPALKAMRPPKNKVLSPGDPGFIALDGVGGAGGYGPGGYGAGGALGGPGGRSGAGGDLAIENDTLSRGALGGPGGQALLANTPEQSRLEEAKALARKNPIAVANIVKEWVNGEAPA
jgi:flagellar M-ring protein FliF